MITIDIKGGNRCFITSYLQDLQLILMQGIHDKFANCKMLCNHCIILLCEVIPQAIHTISISLIHLLLPFLIHKLSKVRISTLLSINSLIHCGGAEAIRQLCAYKEDNLLIWNDLFDDQSIQLKNDIRINYMSYLVNDTNNKVRVLYFQFLSNILIQLRQSNDYETLLIPYILTGLKDNEINQIQQISLFTIKHLAQQYQQYNHEKLKDELYYHQSDYHHDDKLNNKPINLNELLPAIYQGKLPSLSEKYIIYKFIARLLPAICNELLDWQNKTRYNSLTLLKTLLIYGQESLIQYTPTLLKIFIKLEQVYATQVDSQEYVILKSIYRLFAMFITIDSYSAIMIRIMKQYDSQSLLMISIFQYFIPYLASDNQNFIHQVLEILIHQFYIDSASLTILFNIFLTILSSVKIQKKKNKFLLNFF